MNDTEAPKGQVHMSRIEVITGCMFAGKTEELLRRLRRAEIAGLDIDAFTPRIDDRYGEEIIGTHADRQWPAETITVDTDGCIQLQKSDADVVAIDEFNFFDRVFIEAIENLANNGTRVIVSGLDKTYRGDAFEPMGELLAIADKTDKLTAICDECGRDATMTQRIVDGEPASESGPTISIGGQESYEARCRECHETQS